MSIINDALKKVQDNMENAPNENPSAAQPQPTSTPPAPKPSIYPLKKPAAPSTTSASEKKAKPKAMTEGKKSNTPQLLGILLIVFIAFVAYEYKTNPKLFKKITSTSLPQLVKIKSAPKAPKPAPPRVYAPDEIIVQGTMNSGDKWVALINDKIYEAGHQIDNKEITTINLQGIEILENGAKKFIRVKGK